MWLKNLLKEIIMFTLVKLFDKEILRPEETLVKFYFDASGEIFAVETTLAVYKLQKTG